MLTATQLIYQASGLHLPPPPDTLIEGEVPTCLLCGGAAYGGVDAKKHLKNTFNDYHIARGQSNYICSGCLFTFSERSQEIADRMGRPTPQRFRTYSHFVLAGKWLTFSKAHKAQMVAILREQVPEVCIIAESGQKHLAIKAHVNAPNQLAGWVQFEEQTLWLDVRIFNDIFSSVDALYQGGYNKEHISTGRYRFYPDSDVALWREHEPRITPHRGSMLFKLAVYLDTKANTPEPESEENAGE